jgi:predicted Zn-dependent protease with MMP-like domain
MAAPDDKTRIARWQDAAAPDLDDLAALAEKAYRELPRHFLDLTGEIEIRVDDFPSDESLEALALESEFDLLGLFEGVSLAHDSAVLSTGRTPNRIWLYRRPILDYWAEHDETLGAIVAHVLIHEIGHHFGLSDEDMEMLEAEAG